jgi:flavin-binding protein dodecin
LLDRIVELNKLSEEERDTAAKTGLQRAQQVLNQLLAGEDPKK